MGQGKGHQGAHQDQSDDGGDNLRQRLEGQQKNGFIKLEPHRPAQHRIGHRQQPLRQLQHQPAAALGQRAKQHRQQHGPGGDAQPHAQPTGHRRQQQREREIQGQRWKPDNILSHFLCFIAQGIAHHQRRRADDKQHPQILHQRHQPHIGPVLLGHHHHCRRAAGRASPGASGARQRAVADQQPAGKAAYRQGGQQDRQHQRPVVEQHAKNRGINRPGDHAADNGLRRQITGARDAQLHPAQAQNETGDQRPQQQRCRQVYS